MNHNWSATKQHLHPQSVAKISRHSVLSGDRIRQRGTSSGSCHKDTDQCLSVAISFRKHRSVPVPCENGSAETTVAKGGRNPVARLWGRSLVENWPPEPTSSYASFIITNYLWLFNDQSLRKSITHRQRIGNSCRLSVTENQLLLQSCCQLSAVVGNLAHSESLVLHYI